MLFRNHFQATNGEMAKHHPFELLSFPSNPPLYILEKEQILLLEKNVWPKVTRGVFIGPCLAMKISVTHLIYMC